MGAATAELELLHPAAWIAPASPHAEAAGRAATEALRAVGVVRSPRDERVLHAALPAQLGALPFPSADPSALATITLLCAAWAFYDDAVEATGQPDPAVSKALRLGVAPPGSEPIVRAFARAGGGLQVRSAAWRDRFVASFDATVATVAEERDLHTALARGRPPSVATYLRWRRRNIGLEAMLALVEHATGIEPDDAWRADPRVAAWVGACTDVFLAINDHYSARKDGVGGLNLTTCLATRLPPGAAARGVVAFHDAAVARAVRSAEALRARGRSAAWIAGGHQLLAGFAAWHRAAPRYRRAEAARPGTRWADPCLSEKRRTP